MRVKYLRHYAIILCCAVMTFGASMQVVEGLTSGRLRGAKHAVFTLQSTPGMFVLTLTFFAALATLFGWLTLRWYREGADATEEAIDASRLRRHERARRARSGGGAFKLVAAVVCFALAGALLLAARQPGGGLAGYGMLVGLVAALGLVFAGCVLLMTSPNRLVSRFGTALLILLAVLSVVFK